MASRAWSPTLAGVVSGLLEARLAGAEGVRPVGDAVGLVSVPAQRPVTPAVVQLGVCTAHGRTHGRTAVRDCELGLLSSVCC